MSESDRPLLTMKDIHVSYGARSALKGVAFNLMPGEIHAVVGEHRAGKSSLVKILSGAIPVDFGEIHVFGERQALISPERAAELGIGMVYQEPHIIMALSARDNIFTGRCPADSFGFLNKKRMNRETREVFELLNLDFDPDIPLSQLSDAQQNMVEVARVITLNPRIVIFDEISTKLNPKEMKTVYQVIHNLKADGAGIIYISHDMDEVLGLADRVTILKDGYRRGTETVADLDKYRLFELTYSYVLDRDQMKRDRSRFMLMRSYMEKLLHHLPIGAILLDENGESVILNLPAREILGNETDASGGLEALLTKLSEDDADLISRGISEGRECLIDEARIGETTLALIQAFPFDEPTFAFNGTIILIRDIAPNQYLSDYLLQTDKMASVAEVAVGVAHEINNPLFIVQNYLEIIKDESNSHHEEFAKIEKELGRIVEIIGSLLSFSHTKPVRNPKIDLREIAEDVLILLNHAFKAKDIRVTSRVGDYAVFINGEENRIRQLIMNLLNNAIEAVLSGGEVGVFLGIVDNEAILTVTDNGHGIPDDVRTRIYDPFFSTKVNKKNTGLGLAICSQIARENGGSIDVESEPGRRTSFRVKLRLS